MSSGKLHADWLEVFEVNTRKTSCRTESNRDGNTTAARPKRTGDEISKCGVSHSYASVSVISTPKLNNNMIKTRKNVNFTEQWGRWELPMSYVEANKCSGSRSSDLKTSFFFVCVLWLLSSLPRCLCWQRWCKIYVSDLHSRQMHRALKKKPFFLGGGFYSLSVREVKQEQSSRRKAHCHHWPAESKAFLRLGYSVSSYASALG